jgi:hypothetical protein
MLAFHAPPDAFPVPVTRCVAEYFHFKGQIYTTLGLGAIISKATDNGQSQVLLSATILMAAARGHHQPIRVAPPVSARRDTLLPGSLADV